MCLKLLAITAVIGGVVGRALIRARLVRLDDIYIVREFVSLEGHARPMVGHTWVEHNAADGSAADLAWSLALLHTGVPTWTLVGALLFLAIIPLVIWVFTPRGKVFGEIFQQALAQKHVTAELRAAFSDRVIRVCWLYEYLMLPVVLALMVIKPF